VRRICLVGAGYIAQIHAEALRAVPGAAIAAVVDPNAEAARRLAERWGIPRTHASVEEALAAGGLDAAHVLAPPDLHAATALPFLRAGLPVLLEKPLAVSGAECRALTEAAAASGAALGVNQNFVFHPAFAAARRRISAGEFGRPRFVECLYNVPLAQLAARQFGHWMFHAPANILLEQAVHPLSQICAIAGPVRELRAIADAPVEIAPGLPFFPATSITLACERLPAQLRYAVGQSFPFWRLSIVCDDAVVVADILANRVYAHGRTPWMEAVDGLAAGTRTGLSLAWGGVRNITAYGLSQLGLKGRSDGFFRSMRDSIAAFHAGLGGGARFETDGAFGAMLVGACESIRDQAFGAPAAMPVAAPASTPGALPRARAANAAPPCPAADAAQPSDVAILGGTGFIGAETVHRFVAAGMRVAVMARSVRNLPAVFRDPDVTLHRGDIRDAAAVARAIGAAPIVVNLAHGGGGSNYEEVRRAMLGGAETVARTCLAAGVKRLVHVGSIASLYLGPDAGTITGATPSDPRAEERADYTRAKAETDAMLLAMQAQEGLPVVILRPGLVVGEGTSPFHAGLGFFNNEQHCIGWNAGRNPLPFVLVGDVAEAILQAARTPGIEGRCYNLVGDVRPNARDYLRDLAEALGRPLRFHPQSATRLWLEDCAKWAVKRVGGRKVPLPSKRDLVSRGLEAAFDCADARRDLGWVPVADAAEFARQAIAPHVR
jgi:predicted dehydrogenase/nucleoside-diphosphate-sugar epimerase